jgi:hypothetical protein
LEAVTSYLCCCLGIFRSVRDVLAPYTASVHPESYTDTGGNSSDHTIIYPESTTDTNTGDNSGDHIYPDNTTDTDMGNNSGDQNVVPASKENDTVVRYNDAVYSSYQVIVADIELISTCTTSIDEVAEDESTV